MKVIHFVEKNEGVTLCGENFETVETTNRIFYTTCTKCFQNMRHLTRIDGKVFWVTNNDIADTLQTNPWKIRRVK